MVALDPEVPMEFYDADTLAKLALNIEKVARAAEQLMAGPLTEEAVLLLIKHKLYDKRMSTATIRDVITAAQRLRGYLKMPTKKEAKR